MTGRTLYDKYVDSLKSDGEVWTRDRYGTGETGYQLAHSLRPTMSHHGKVPPAWPFLTSAQQRVWSGLAKKVAPAPRKRRG